MGSNNLGEKREEEKVGAASSVSVHACFMESNHFVCRTAVNIPHKDSLDPFSSIVGTVASGQKKRKTNTGETDRHQKKIFIPPPLSELWKAEGLCIKKADGRPRRF